MCVLCKELHSTKDKLRCSHGLAVTNTAKESCAFNKYVCQAENDIPTYKKVLIDGLRRNPPLLFWKNKKIHIHICMYVHIKTPESHKLPFINMFLQVMSSQDGQLVGCSCPVTEITFNFVIFSTARGVVDFSLRACSGKEVITEARKHGFSGSLLVPTFSGWKTNAAQTPS